MERPQLHSLLAQHPMEHRKINLYYFWPPSPTPILVLKPFYQDIQRPLLREEGDGAPASSGTQ